MLVTVTQCAAPRNFTLTASGFRSYTFTSLPIDGTDGGAKVLVRFAGPRHATEAVVPVQEARELWTRLLKRGYEQW